MHQPQDLYNYAYEYNDGINTLRYSSTYTQLAGFNWSGLKARLHMALDPD